MKRIITTTILTLGLVIPSATIAATRYYVHKPECSTGHVAERVRVQERKHGKIVRRHHRIVWVRRWECVKVKASTKPSPTPTTPTTPAPAIHYSTKVDPTFTTSSASPLSVTYTYSADATATVGTVTTDLAQTGALPSGVINFYSSMSPGQAPEQLLCSATVGASVSSATCPATYPAIGSYQVTTQYIPTGATATTETDTETISPFSTTTSLSTQTSGSTTVYNASVTDQNDNAVTVDPSSVVWNVTDTTTGQNVGTFYNVGGAAYFRIVTDYVCNPGCSADGQSIAVYKAGQTTQVASGDWINPSDSFTVTASYTPAAGGVDTGSTSAASPLVLSP